MIILYGKKDCEMCNKAKTKMQYNEVAYEFRELPEFFDQHKFILDPNWRDTNIADLATAYCLYWPMPLPLFQFPDGEIKGYADGLARVAQELKAKKAVAAEVVSEQLAVA